jgi:hypothetical protein
VNHPGFKLTDHTLLRHDLSTAAKLVLGVSLALPGRNPSQRYLERWLPVPKAEIQAAQDELEAKGVCTLDRPKSARDRNPHNPRFARWNKIVAVRNDAEPNRRSEGDNPRRAYILGSLAASLPRGRGFRNLRLYPLLVLLYAREQARRQAGAIQLPHDLADELLGFPNGTTADLWNELHARGLVAIIEGGDTPIFTLVDGPEGDEDFEPQKSRHLHHIGPVKIIGTAKQFELAQARASDVDEAWLDFALTRAAALDGHHEPTRAVTADSFILALAEAANGKRIPHDPPKESPGSTPKTKVTY